MQLSSIQDFSMTFAKIEIERKAQETTIDSFDIYTIINEKNGENI